MKPNNTVSFFGFKLGLGSLCVALIAGSVIVSVVPQWVVWYVQANASTRGVSRDLIREVADKVMVALELTISQAEQMASELALIAEASTDTCSDDVSASAAAVHRDWRSQFLQVSLAERAGWAVIAADRFGSTLSIYGTPPEIQRKSIPGVPFIVNEIVTNRANGTIDIGPLKSSTQSFDVFTRPWYRDAVSDPGRLRWGRFFIGVPSGRKLIAVSETHGSLKEPDRVCGVRGVLMGVAGWQNFLRRQRVGKTGNVWLIEADTMLLFSTTKNTSLFVGNTSQRVFAINSTDGMTRDVGRWVAKVTSGGSRTTEDISTVDIGGVPCQVMVRHVHIHPETGFAPMYYVVAVPVEDYWGEIHRGIVVTVSITVVLSAFSLAVSTAAGVFFVSRPLARTTKTLSRLSRLRMEDLAPPTPSSAAHEVLSRFGGNVLLSEVSDLLTSASKMAESLFIVGRYVSRDLCRWIIENKVTEMPLVPKTVSVLFCGIQGTTAMIDRCKTESSMSEFGRMLNEILTTLANAVKHHGGYIDKLMGNEVMALFNAPYECKDHQVHACAAALTMCSAVAELCHSWDQLGLYSIFQRPRVRIGVATGEVLAGDIGAIGTVTHFTAIGDTVCTAAHLQRAAKVIDPEGTDPPMLVFTIAGTKGNFTDDEQAAMKAFDCAMQSLSKCEWADCIKKLRKVALPGYHCPVVKEAQVMIKLAQSNIEHPNTATNVTHDLNVGSVAALKGGSERH
eukprot:m51a1_g2058 hypothetical protein (733) ;mRNA; r:1413357-1415866